MLCVFRVGFQFGCSRGKSCQFEHERSGALRQRPRVPLATERTFILHLNTSKAYANTVVNPSVQSPQQAVQVWPLHLGHPTYALQIYLAPCLEDPGRCHNNGEIDAVGAVNTATTGCQITMLVQRAM